MSAQFLRQIDSMSKTLTEVMGILRDLSAEMIKLENRITSLESRKPVGRPPKDGRQEAPSGN